MTTMQELLASIQDLPLTALERVSEFINKQPYKKEKRQPTGEEVQMMKVELEKIIMQLRAELGNQDDDDDSLLDRLKNM